MAESNTIPDRVQRVSVDPETAMLKLHHEDGHATALSPEFVVDLIAMLLRHDLGQTVRDIGDALRGWERRMELRREDEARSSMHACMVPEGDLFRCVYVRIVKLDPTDTLTGRKYEAEPAKNGGLYKNLGSHLIDWFRVPLEGQKVLWDEKTNRQSLWERVSD